MTDSREQALRDVVELRAPLNDAIPALEAYPWDSEEELVTLTTDHVRAVLDRYLDGSLPAEDVQRWAETLEGRDDLALTETLIDVLFELASPEIQGELTEKKARDLI